MKHLAPTIAILLMGLVVTGQQQPGVMSADADANQVQPAAADGLWIGIGPDMKVLPLGTYRFLFIPADPAKQVNVTTVTTGEGTPGSPDPPPTGDLSSKVAAALAKVTDPDKAKTAGNLVKMYDEFIKSADTGAITNASQLATAIQMLTTIATSGKAGWGDFNTLVSSTLSGLSAVASVQGKAIENDPVKEAARLEIVKANMESVKEMIAALKTIVAELKRVQ